MTNYLPIMLKLEQKKVVIVGGGNVAMQKVTALLDMQALITVVSPVLHEKMIPFVQQAQIIWLEKSFEPNDIEGAFLIFAATNDVKVNEAVEAAKKEGQLLNRADNQRVSDYITPASIRRGPLVLSVSTSGASPALARKIKEGLAEQFDEVYEEYVTFLQQARLLICATLEKGERRSSVLKELLHPQYLQWTREGQFANRELALRQLLARERTS